MCKEKYAAVNPEARQEYPLESYYDCHINGRNEVMFVLTIGANGRLCGINSLTHMSLTSTPKNKQDALRATGTLNARSAQVRHSSFQTSEFFDPEDLLQLKYEALRALKSDGCSIAKAATDFGLSRPTIYQAQQQFEEQELPGLLPRKRGPKQPSKLTPQIHQYLQELAVAEPHLKAAQLATRLRGRFQVKVHPRTIEKALKSRAKRGLQASP